MQVQSQNSRRQFLTNTMQAGTLSVASQLGVASALGLSATGFAHASEQHDLLRSLGQQAATAAIAQIGSPGASYSIGFLDCSSDDLNAIRAGAAQVFGSNLKSLDELQGYCPASLGIATFTNLDTERRAVVDIYATSLSLMSFTQDAAQSSTSQQRSMFMQVPSSNLFSIQIS